MSIIIKPKFKEMFHYFFQTGLNFFSYLGKCLNSDINDDRFNKNKEHYFYLLAKCQFTNTKGF
jgi:hypothetical protein